MENLNAISCQDALNNLESKLKEKGFFDSKMVYESMQNYFHENIKKIIADERFSLYNLARIWIPYINKFKTQYNPQGKQKVNNKNELWFWV